MFQDNMKNISQQFASFRSNTFNKTPLVVTSNNSEKGPPIIFTDYS